MIKKNKYMGNTRINITKKGQKVILTLLIIALLTTCSKNQNSIIKISLRASWRNCDSPVCLVGSYSLTFSPSSRRRSRDVLSVLCSSSGPPDSNSCSWSCSWLSSSAPSAVDRDLFSGAFTKPAHTQRREFSGEDDFARR